MEIFLGAHFYHVRKVTACKNNDPAARYHMEKFTAKTYTIHVKYQEMPIVYDIAMILLDAKAFRSPICLPIKGPYDLQNGSS